jgi:hypothetical protein
MAAGPLPKAQDSSHPLKYAVPDTGLVHEAID